MIVRLARRLKPVKRRRLTLAASCVACVLAFPFGLVFCDAAPLVIDAFDYPDDAAARAAWTAMAGSPDVEMADTGPWGDERVMRLPLNFSVQADRCYWDRGVSL